MQLWRISGEMSTGPNEPSEPRAEMPILWPDPAVETLSVLLKDKSESKLVMLDDTTDSEAPESMRKVGSVVEGRSCRQHGPHCECNGSRTETDAEEEEDSQSSFSSSFPQVVAFLFDLLDRSFFNFLTHFMTSSFIGHLKAA